ncbi:MAG: hypothetical protein HOP18_27565 [Deltaproteobacteria bacterium]|nr:hypothetical protein [Deltaproteobacteria bacterium]
MQTHTKQFIMASGICSLFLGAPGWPARVEAAGVQARFGIESPSAGPFPSNLFTVPDPTQNTGLRVNLPKPDCAVRVSDCQNIEVINTLDGFNPQPRLSIPFTGPIDVNTVTSETVFLLSLGSALSEGAPGGQVVGINQVVWDPDTNTLHVESDELLDQHTRYALIVTNGVRDTAGDSVAASEAFVQFRHDLNYGQTKDKALKAYRKALLDALAAAHGSGSPHQIVAASVFTTQSTTAVLEKIRDQIKAEVPEPADFLLGPGGTRTVFPLSNVSSIFLRLQTGTAPTFNPPASLALLLAALRAIPGAAGTIAYGKYVSPNYEDAGRVIPPVGTLTGEPVVQGENNIYFNLVLPSGTPPPNGWPVAIFGHGATGSKDVRLFLFAAEMAERGIATIGINAVGHGNGPLSTLTVTPTSGAPLTFPSGGRGVDLNGDGGIGADEGISAVVPRGIVSNRDGARQTVVDWMQLVREIEVGMDVDGDTVPDLDPARMYYFGQSMGGIQGTIFLAIEPSVQAGVPNVPGGANIEVARLSPVFRPAVGATLASRIPSLINVGGLIFNENIPLRDQPPVINIVPGALDIQQVFEWSEWVTQAGNSVAYAPHLRRAPLEGMLPKDILVQFAKGDQTVSNPTATALLRAGELADRATYYRHDLAFPSRPGAPKDPHAFLLYNSISPLLVSALGDVGAGARQQIAEFFASDGVNVIDPDGAGPLFEVPIVGPLPEELNFIP